MASMEDRRVRRALQHWSIFALGILIPAARSSGLRTSTRAMNATLLSLVLLGSTGFELAGFYVWQDTCVFLCGTWSAVSPLAFGYAEAGQLRYWHVTSGALLMLLGAFNLWKDGAGAFCPKS